MPKLQRILIGLATLVLLVNGCVPVFPGHFVLTPTPSLGDFSISPADGMTMIFIPKGGFPMGSETGLTDERPVHTVFLYNFWIDKTEVTNATYKMCVKSGSCKPPDVNTFFNDPNYSQYPVVNVSWADAKKYCDWAGRRLPTEAEWEKAASWDPVNANKRTYPWGNDFDCERGNFEGASCDGYEGTAPVGSFPSGASPYGVMDMGGNVWEWVHDAFLETDPLVGGTKNYYSISPASNPQGVDPSITIYRVMRGGGWKINFGFGRSSYRLWFGLDDSYDFAGFRCAASP